MKQDTMESEIDPKKQEQTTEEKLAVVKFTYKELFDQLTEFKKKNQSDQDYTDEKNKLASRFFVYFLEDLYEVDNVDDKNPKPKALKLDKIPAFVQTIKELKHEGILISIGKKFHDVLTGTQKKQLLELVRQSANKNRPKNKLQDKAILNFTQALDNMIGSPSASTTNGSTSLVTISGTTPTASIPSLTASTMNVRPRRTSKTDSSRDISQTSESEEPDEIPAPSCWTFLCCFSREKNQTKSFVTAIKKELSLGENENKLLTDYVFNENGKRVYSALVNNPVKTTVWLQNLIKKIDEFDLLYGPVDAALKVNLLYIIKSSYILLKNGENNPMFKVQDMQKLVREADIIYQALSKIRVPNVLFEDELEKTKFLRDCDEESTHEATIRDYQKPDKKAEALGLSMRGDEKTEIKLEHPKEEKSEEAEVEKTELTP